MAKRTKAFLLKDRYIHEYYNTSIHRRRVPVTIYRFERRYAGDVQFEMVSESVRGSCISSRENVENHVSPVIDDLPSLIQQLRVAIEKNAIDLTGDLLGRDFVLEKQGRSYEVNGIHTNTPSEVAGHYYTYQQYCVRPAIEELLLKQPLAFKELIEESQNSFGRAQYVNHLRHIKLTDKNEAINFQDFNLTHASFNGAILGNSNLLNARTSNVDFTDCDLSQTNVTQEQLDLSSSYRGAKIPNSCWSYWDISIKNELLKRFNEMKQYTEKNISKEDPKYKKVMELYNTHQFILSRAGNINTKEKEAMLASLTAKDAQSILGKNRHLSFILAEMVSFVLLLGIGYLLVAAYKKRQTGHFGLFAEPKTAKIAREMQGVILSTSPSRS